MKKMLLLAGFLFVLAGCGQKAQESTENKSVEIKKEIPVKKEEVKEEVNNEETENVSVENNQTEEDKTIEKNQGFSDTEKEQAKKMVKDFFNNHYKILLKVSEEARKHKWNKEGREIDENGKLVLRENEKDYKFATNSNFVTKNFIDYMEFFYGDKNKDFNHNPVTCSQDSSLVKSVTLINQNDPNFLLFSLKFDVNTIKVHVVREGSNFKIDKVLCN